MFSSELLSDSFRLSLATIDIPCQISVRLTQCILDSCPAQVDVYITTDTSIAFVVDRTNVREGGEET